MAVKKTKEENRPVLHTKAQLLSSKRYSDRKDLIQALLEEDKKYTISEVEGIIEKFMKGRVK